MERTESQTNLIPDEKEMQGGHINEYSSGYESASDNEVYSETTKEASFSQLNTMWREQHQHATKEKMSYQNTVDLSSHLRYIMSMPELCDVTFIVGVKETPVYGVKAIMGARSRVIYNIILKKQRDLEFQVKSKKKQQKSKQKAKTSHHLVITVRKYEADDFKKIIEYLHCGTVDISSSNIAGLLCGASQFELDDLVRACWDFISHCTQSGSLSLLIPAARRYSQHTAGNTLISWILGSNRKTSTV